ncbi:MAG: hypothetical protein ACHQ6T_09500 [Myxococcota bacterium]
MTDVPKTARPGDDLEQRLEVELECTECGATFVAGVWDHSFRCSFCGSVLACERALGEEVFAVSDGGSTSADGLALLIRNETESHRNELIGRAKGPDGNGVEFPAVIEAQVAEFRARLERELSLAEAGDFLVPYELHERTVFQGVLGRRGEAKESIVQSICTEDVRRRYDPARFNLRDRGLKLRGSRVALLQESHLARAGGRALDVASGAECEPIGDRARVQTDPGLEVISHLEDICSERRLRVWKQMGFARIRRGTELEDYLIDRQFGTVAGRLEGHETDLYRALAPRPLEEVLRKPVLRAIASECPNCGAELALSPRACVAFCATCHVGIRISAAGLSELAYEFSPTAKTDGAEALIGYPFWAFPARVRAGNLEFTRFWDWLEKVSPQPAATRFRENDPAEARLFLPARAVFGARELDDAFAALCAVATWRQPTVEVGRPQPGDGVSSLDVELDEQQASALAHFALVALHDRQSTRRLTGLSFKQWVADAQVTLGAPRLVVLPLPIHGGQWLPAGPAAQRDLRQGPVFPKPVARAVLEDAGQIPRRSLAFSLR